MAMSLKELTESLKAEGLRLGFDQVGIAPAVPAPGFPNFLDWLDDGCAAGMDYLGRKAQCRQHPASVLDAVRSVVMVSVIYGENEPDIASPDPTRGKVARYARGSDYHRVLWDKLEQLLVWLRARCPDVRGRAVVDTAPLLERDFARLAGLGWIGKNTMLISRRLGSFTFLGALLTDAELAYDAPHAANHCGTCTRCLEACPTHAFTEPYRLDARQCISYWTIEHKGLLDDEDASRLNGWAFGCDICQDVCPWNRKAPSGRVSPLDARADWVDPDLLEWLSMDLAEWKRKLKGTALSRAKRAGLLRNAAVILATRGLRQAVGPLVARLDDHGEEQVVRASASWALGRIGGSEARDALIRHRDDPDSVIGDAVIRALDYLDNIFKE
jgi:epoxyqueuosine reductase